MVWVLLQVECWLSVIRLRDHEHNNGKSLKQGGGWGFRVGVTHQNFGWGCTAGPSQMRPCPKLANRDPFKSVYIRNQLNGIMDSLVICVFQENYKETAPISK